MWRFLAFSLLVAYLTSSRMRVVRCSFTRMFLVEVQNPYLLWSCASPKANFAQR
jgi:hypothetical protein